ncbi:MAG: AAA family ATPase, partial [Calditrichaceae bacterium]
MSTTAVIQKKQSSAEVIARKLSILIEINQALSRSQNLREAMSAALQILEKSYNIKSGAVFLLDDDGESMSMVASVGYKIETAKSRYKIGEGLTGRVAE